MASGFRQCAAQFATSEPISNLHVCRTARNGTWHPVKWVGKAKRSARSAHSSRIPNDVTTVALHSRGVTAGSMRGFGTLQSMTALEVLVDEIAASLPLDPIEFRRRNALKTGGRTVPD